MSTENPFHVRHEAIESDPPSVPLPRAWQKLQDKFDDIFNAINYAIEPWHLVDDTDEPAFKNSWANYGSTHPPASFRQDPRGRVYLRGFVKNGTVGATTPIFTLPEGYRPPYDISVPTVSAGVFGYVLIEQDGDVIPVVGNNAWFSLNSIEFFTS